MNVIFSFQEVKELITTRYEPLAANATAEQQTAFREVKKNDNKALLLIHQCVDSSNFEKIAGAKTAKAAWDILSNAHGGGDKVKKVKLQSLRRQYELLGMMDKESIGEYFTRLQTLVNSMKNYGETISDQLVIEKVLRTLNPQYDHIVVAIEESKDLSIITVNELQSTLEAHKQRLQERKERKENKASQEQALYEKNGGQWNKNGKGKNKCKGEKNKGKGEFSNDHNGDQDQSESSKKDRFIKGKNGGKKSDKSKIQCYNCEKWGHYAFECRSKGKKKQDNKAHHARQHDSDSDGFLLMVATNSESDNSKLWYLDTECSNHKIEHRYWLLEFDENFKSKVKFADDNIISVEGKGKVMVQRKNGNHTFVTDVLYVPTMKHNLLSLGQLLEKEFNYSTKDHYIKVFDPHNKLIIKAPLSKNRTFK
ncbi:uncharacterized protein LOC123922907 [Trifolium pratense]|uniref:uncharacterized protein LOC123922907 n=1 Tax=Trifolium pratense TaxID=57577 RepID=UPI001E693D08|nr:uncharacterized protein LOC123922907 [Trifolium pratense]